MPKPQYVAGEAEARQLYSRVQALRNENLGGVQIATPITFPAYGHTLHVAPGTTVRIDYRGARPTDFDRAEITFLTDHSADRAARQTLESFAGITLIEIQESSREPAPTGATA